MSNFPLSYRLSWPARFLGPTVAGDVSDYLPLSAMLLAAPPVQSVRLAFVGDISAVANGTPPLVDPGLGALLASADLVVGNCESPVVQKPYAGLGTRLGTRHAMTAEFLAGVLFAASIAPEKLVLSLANNHMLDQGVAGYEQTLSTLGRLGIRTIGAGCGMARVGAGPLALGLVAFTQWRNRGAADFSGRVAMATDFFADMNGALAGREAVDLVCAIPHWDWEFRHSPRAETRAMARRLAENGVGLIAGHHAHVVQPVEQCGATLVAYGLGDFLGTAFSRQPWPGRIGAIFVAEVSVDAATRGQVASYRLVPFFRLRDGDRERLMPVEALEGALADKVRARLDAIFGPAKARSLLVQLNRLPAVSH